jgi:hypothetical protein
LAILGGSLRVDHWGVKDPITRNKGTLAMSKHIQTPPKVNSLTNKRPTSRAQGETDNAWEQIGLPLARVLSKCAEAQWRQQLIEKAKDISRSSDIGAGEQVRQLCEAIHDGGEK